MGAAANLRAEISARNRERAVRYLHEHTSAESPAIIYAADENGHGNFHPASWRAIQRNPQWSARLEKAYTASNHVPRSNDRWRGELECATSSDALLMNIFCHPQTLRSVSLRAMLGVQQQERPIFGWRPYASLEDDHIDRTEIDMRLGDLLVEAKLCETGFQTARLSLIRRYKQFEETFDADRLPQSSGSLKCYQLVRGILAASHHNARFCLMCDARRGDLIEAWFHTLAAVHLSQLRCRLQLITWQEITRYLSPAMQNFLAEKYGIFVA